MNDVDWIKATRSAANGDCVEVRRRGDAVQVRDSKDPDGGVLHLTGPEFTAWLDGARRGEFDHLAD